MARWLSEEAVDLYDKLTMDDHANFVTAAYDNCPVSITPFLLSKMKTIPIDDADIYVAWAKECYVDLAAPKPDW